MYRISNISLLAFLFALNLTASTVTLAVDPQWHMINVNNHGQGDAHLIIDGNIKGMIDLGEYDQATSHLVPYLKARGINHLDFVIISHPHTDHYGGLKALHDAGIAVNIVYSNLPPESVEDWNYKRSEFLNAVSLAGQHVQIEQGYVIPLNTASIKILYALKTTAIDGKQATINDYSIVMRWDAGGVRTLFTGDLDYNLGSVLSTKINVEAEILKVPHHGVTSMPPDSFFNSVDPQLTMNPSTTVLWGHSRGYQFRSWVGNRMHCHNGLNGNVVIRFGDAITLIPERETDSCRSGVLEIERRHNKLVLSPIFDLLMQ